MLRYLGDDVCEVDILVGGRWHAPEVAAGLRSLGVDVRLLSSDPLVSEAASSPLLHQGRRLADRLALDLSILHRNIGVSLAKQVRPNARVVAWSSFAWQVIENGHPTVVVRGSQHIFRQREILRRLQEEMDVRVRLPSLGMIDLERREYQSAGRVTVPTPGIASDPLWAEDKARIATIPYGFSSPIVRCLPGTYREGASACFAGEVGYRKGVDRLVAAFGTKGHPLRKMTLVGGRPRNSPTLPDWWTVRGSQPPRVVQATMASSEVFVLPSREEGMSRAAMEAIAVGTPIIASPISGLGQWIQQGCGIEVSSNSGPEELREAASAIREHWDDHHVSCLETAKSWTWEDHSRELMRTLNSLA